jgi:ribosome-associated toxin RatA of RatAB toxin-antitoxin module
MLKVSVTANIRGTESRLFAMSQDYAQRLEWDPFVTKIELMNGATEPDVGVDTYVETVGGMAMVTRYISFKPPRVAAITMVGGPRSLKSFSGGWTFRQVTPDVCNVTFSYNFRTNPRWLSWLMEPVAGIWYRREMQARISRFKEWVEYGWSTFG